ncbi:RND family transporter [candidate division KSB1 bacterium]|nr:RND family transporter [candidate division KSB1 bacterium]
MKSLAERIITCRWVVISAFLFTTLAFLLQIPGVEIDTDLKSQLPRSMPSRADTDKIDALFGGTEMLMLIVEAEDVLQATTLERIRTLAKRMKRIAGVDRVISLFDLKSIRSEDGAMIIEPAVPFIPQDDESREQLRQTLQQNDLVYGSVVARDFSLAAVIVLLEPGARDDLLLAGVDSVLAQIPGGEKVKIGGLPVSRVEMGLYIQKDMRLLLPIGIFIMLIFLFACFRQLRGVLLPSMVVVMSIIVTIGFIALIGWKIHMVTVILPIFLIAVANDYGIHLVARYQEDDSPANACSRKELVIRLLQELSRPVLLTGLTTMAGMLCLLGHILIPARQLGVLAALGIFFALMASLLLIPALLSLLPRKAPVLAQMNVDSAKMPMLERILRFFGRGISQHPRSIILTCLLIALISVIGISAIVVDTNPDGYYKADHPTVRVNKLIDEHLGGSQSISVVYKGDIQSPALMRKIDKMEHDMLAMDEVGVTTSVARILRQMSRALHDRDEPMYDELPETRTGIAQYFELYSMSGDPDDFRKMGDFPYEHAVVTARINKTSTLVLQRVVERLKEMVKDDADVLLVGGFGVVLSDLARTVVNGQILSLILAIIVVSVLLALLFRSCSAGLLAAVPLMLSAVVLFGLMGFLGIELNITTAMLSSIMIGVGVDYTIHFLWRYREERRAGRDCADAAQRTLSTTGRGIIFNAFSVIVGFSVLLLSSFAPVRFFGFLIVVSILTCLSGALVLIPALCIFIRPAFLEPVNSSAREELS